MEDFLFHTCIFPVLKWEPWQGVSAGYFRRWLQLNIVVVRREKKGPALQSSSSQNWSRRIRSKYFQQGFVISSQSELASEEIHVKFGDPKNNGKTFLLDLTVVFLRWVQGPGGICDRSLITIREAVKYDCSDAILACIALKNNRKAWVIMNQYIWRWEWVLGLFKCLLAPGGPLEVSVTLEKLIEWLEDRAQVSFQGRLSARWGSQSVVLVWWLLPFPL